jgi:tetratricopeptide (TPR) repeat protein
MKRYLPESATKVIALFPSNIRSITEYSFSPDQSKNVKVGLISTFSLFLIALIFIQSVTLWHNMQQREVYIQQRVAMEQELAYWQGVADKYQGYRDVYYRIASIQYKLGNTAASQEYLKKALELDPNFPEGRVLGTKVGL